MAKMTIDLWGDITCPYCYVGEYLLEEALHRSGLESEIHVRWKSCRLRPDHPPGEVLSFEEALLHEGVSQEKIEDKVSKISRFASKHGIKVKMYEAKVVSTLDAARLLKEANRQGCTLPVAKAFGEGYAVLGLDMSDPTNLKSLALRAGMTEEGIDRVLSSDEHDEEVRRDQEEAQTKAREYIPTVYFNHGHKLEGVLDADLLLRHIQLAYSEYQDQRSETDRIDTEMLGADSCAQ